MNSDVKLFFYGGVGTVTGANFLITDGNFKALIDCGLLQDFSKFEENLKLFPYNPKEIDYLFVTHAHIDHIGRIPKLIRDGFRGEIYSNQETRDISEIMLKDALKVMNENFKRIKIQPIWTDEDLDKSLSLWKTIDYYKEFNFRKDVSVTLKNSGHILGSSLINFNFKDLGNVLFTGDLGNSFSVLMKKADDISDADYIITESVYGDREHENVDSSREVFIKAVLEGVNLKSTILIPSFSLERTQVLLYEIKEMMKRGDIPSISVFLDSPLALSLMPIYEKYKNNFKKEILGSGKIFDFPSLEKGYGGDTSRGPKIIISGAGMSTGGKILSYYLKYLPKPNTFVILTGFQAPGTLGRRLEDGTSKVSISGKDIKVKARILAVKGYSSHADSEDLLNFIDKSSGKLKKVFTVMGEPKSSLSLVQKIRDYLDIDAVYPEVGKEYKLFN